MIQQQPDPKLSSDTSDNESEDSSYFPSPASDNEGSDLDDHLDLEDDEILDLESTEVIDDGDPSPAWNEVEEGALPFEVEPTIRQPMTSLQQTSTPWSILSIILDNNFWTHLVTETNNYAKYLKTNPKKSVKLSWWTDTDVNEMKKFIGLLLNMAIHSKKNLKGIIFL